MHFTLKKGTKRKSVLLFARGTGGGQPGLSSTTAGSYAAYIREGDAAAVRVPLLPGKLGEHQAGGIVEVNPELMPGVYQFGIPDDMLADDADGAILVLRFPGCVFEPVEVSLVAYDARDTNRLGLDALGPGGRIAALRGAFPKLTAQELARTEAEFRDS